MSRDRIAGAVVVAIDGSEDAERALSWAADQAALEGRRLVTLTAGGVSAEHGRAAAAAVRSRHPELSAESMDRPEDPREALIAASRTAHLLVLGSRGRGTMASLLLGSVSAAVSAHAMCPVVVCRPSPETGVGSGVLVGADGTVQSREVIEFAFRVASLRRSPLTVLHCYWDAVAAVTGLKEATPEMLDRPEFGDLRAVLAESVAGFGETYPDVAVTLSARHGLLDRALASGSEVWGLIVVGRHPVTSLGNALTGSIATAVLERAACPVAVVPEAASEG